MVIFIYLLVLAFQYPKRRQRALDSGQSSPRGGTGRTLHAKRAIGEARRRNLRRRRRSTAAWAAMPFGEYAERYVDRRVGTISAATVVNERRYLKYAKATIGSIPLKELVAEDVERCVLAVPRLSEAERFLERASSLPLGMTKVAVLILFSTGMRPEEMLALRVGLIPATTRGLRPPPAG